MTLRPRSEDYRVTNVYIDSYENGIMCGSFYNPYMEEHTPFTGTMKFLVEMENVLDSMEFPKSFTAMRSFASPPEHNTGPPDTPRRTGEKATFAVRILFRQNTSWQGSVTWLEGRLEQSFRSALELLMLMDSVLSCKAAS